ncbi:Hypothetical predicted protein [Podarcis lilfordi]|uniref:Uncharacterized protein n=1 Tax=Podarcis lilfordi TaxID=74358 RepID=A0AA35KVT1_9SAUR|nr:Hypothetical predicted protein [Podarcis lilfordi]
MPPPNLLCFRTLCLLLHYRGQNPPIHLSIVYTEWQHLSRVSDREHSLPHPEMSSRIICEDGDNAKQMVYSCAMDTPRLGSLLLHFKGRWDCLPLEMGLNEE